MRLLPLPEAEGGPVPLAPDVRPGVVVYWAAPPPPTATVSKRRRSVDLRPTWDAQMIRFDALGLPGPPGSPDDVARTARLAFAFAASHHPIPSYADVYYEIRT